MSQPSIASESTPPLGGSSFSSSSATTIIQTTGNSQSRILRPQLDTLASLATSPRPAYTLATIFALSAPFGFSSAVQGQEASSGHKHAPPANSVSSAKGSSLMATKAMPPFWQLAGLAAIFAGGGYIIEQGDPLNGSGVISAWSITYLIFRTMPTLTSLVKSPLALGLSLSTATLGLGVHGSYYFDKTSWKGAVPGLLDVDSGALARQSKAVEDTVERRKPQLIREKVDEKLASSIPDPHEVEPTEATSASKPEIVAKAMGNGRFRSLVDVDLGRRSAERLV
ncbi:hypothetical protein IE53DRAFT_366690 [Violaceomyces palustris]|uniref:Uncharacterized protein n=1 Tax=Violaceomyces palustris TaxID=1673888 RepID=A0ACD0P4R8_9BASI|nr:hypothetical protein IE53DRAFT_366690 [Violaceomyces palustris]